MLIFRWKAEIESKTTSGRKVLIHWGGKRTDSAIQLKQYDVVLTTYGILTAEHGKQVCTLSEAMSSVLTKQKQKQKQKPKARRRNDSDDSDDGISRVDPLSQGMSALMARDCADCQVHCSRYCGTESFSMKHT